MILDDYLNAYLDRRMKYHIEEWGLATGRDVEDIGQRIAAIEQEIGPRKAFDKSVQKKVAALEARLKHLKEAQR